MHLVRSTRRLHLAAITSCAAMAALAAAATPARAVIERPYPLDRAVADNDAIVVARVDRLDPARPSVVLNVETDLKGAPAARRIPVLLAGENPTQSKLVVERLAAGMPLVLFMTGGPQPDQMLILAYTEGTWFQVIGQKDGDALRGGLTHVEPYLRRTFNRSTQQLVQLITDIQAGKAQAPPIDRAAQPGVGPPAGAGEPATKLYPVPTDTAAAPGTPTTPPPDSTATTDQSRALPPRMGPVVGWASPTNVAPARWAVPTLHPWAWAAAAAFVVIAIAFTAVAFKRRNGSP